MDHSERELLAATVRDALAHTDDADAALVDLGWPDMLAAEPDAAIEIVFHELGRSNATSTALDDVVLHALGVDRGGRDAALLPPFGASALSSNDHDEGDGGAIEGLASHRATAAEELVVVVGDRIAAVGTSFVDLQPVHGVDPSVRLFTARVDSARAFGASRATRADGAWDDAVALARRAVAHEIAGASRTMLDLARTHALERVQFGRPVARFQAVRHKLAEALVAVETLDAVLGAAADEPSVTTAALAKAAAGRTARIVATHAQQVLAGIGFTTDHAFHRSFKRTIVLDGLFGSADTVTRELGRTLLASGDVPTLVEL
jgi:hypothetical protein